MISKIIDNIYIGNWQDASKYRNGFITFTVAYDSPFKGNFYYEIEDSKNASYSELLSAITDLYRVRTSDTDNKILVHCVSGFSRATIVVSGYLMLKYHMTVQDAIGYIKTQRDIGDNPNPGLVELLLNSKELNHG